MTATKVGTEIAAARRVRIDADIQAVWNALNDPEVLGASMPGCESIEQIDPLNLQAAVRAKVGPVNAVFKAALTLSEVQAPNSYTLSGEVKAAGLGWPRDRRRSSFRRYRRRHKDRARC